MLGRLQRAELESAHALAIAAPVILLACLSYLALSATPDLELASQVSHPDCWQWEHALGRQRTFRAFFALVVLGGLVAACWRPREAARPRDALLYAGAVAVFAGLALNAARPSSVLPTLALGAGAVVMLRFTRARRSRAAFWAVAALGVVGLAPYLLVANYLLFSTDVGDVVNFEDHYIVVVAAAERLADGGVLFDDVRPKYGLLPALLVGNARRLAGDLPLSAYVHVQALATAGFLALAMSVAYRVSKNVIIFLLLGAFTIAWHNFGSQGFINPNQGALRFLGFPFMMWALSRVDAETARGRAVAVGAAVLAILWNTETGIAVLAGTLVFVCAGPLAPRDLARRVAAVALLLLAALGTAAALVALLALTASGHLPRLTPGALWQEDFAVNTGIALTFNAAAVTVAVGCLVQLYHAIPRRHRLSRGERLRAACATTCVVWFVYFINRSDPAYLYGHLLLFSPIAAAWLRHARVSLRRPARGRAPLPLAALALAALVAGLGPAAWDLGERALIFARIFRERRRQALEHGSVVLFGMHLHRPLAERLAQERATIDEVLERAGTRRLLLLDLHPLLFARLMGRRIDLPEDVPLGDLFTRARLERTLTAIREADAPLFLETFDAPLADPVAAHRMAHGELVLEHLGADWVLVERRGSLRIYRSRASTTSGPGPGW